MNKKKLTVNRLAMGNLKARKKQYTLMIIGIVLAMIFSSGVMFFVFSALSSFNELDKLSFGNQDAVLMNAQYYNFDRAIENDLIDDYSFAHAIGYGYNEETGEENGSLMAWYDEDAYALSYVGLREGRFPEKKGEIAFERDALVRMKLNAQIGDQITLTVKTPKSENYLSEYFYYPLTEKVLFKIAVNMCAHLQDISSEQKAVLHRRWLFIYLSFIIFQYSQTASRVLC